jgi:hypothetical protein
MSSKFKVIAQKGSLVVRRMRRIGDYVEELGAQLVEEAGSAEFYVSDTQSIEIVEEKE